MFPLELSLEITSGDSYVVLQGSQGEGNRPYTTEADIQHRQRYMTYPHAPVHRPAQRNQEEVTWFCSECHDGPYLDWHDHCQECGHRRCARCRKEKRRLPREPRF
jgi:hypothetical protein